MPPTLCIFNERAGPNLSPHERAALFSQLEVKLGAIQLAVTQASAEVEPLLWEAILRGAKRVIALGGDGTVHHLVGALMRIRTAGEPHALPAFGVLPLGTGCDWSRGIGQPLGRAAALAWLARATPQPIDIGELHTDNAQAFFLNIASCGLAGEVSRRAQSLRRKRAWTYLALTLRALHSFQRPQLSVAVDGRRWFEGTHRPARLLQWLSLWQGNANCAKRSNTRWTVGNSTRTSPQPLRALAPEPQRIPRPILRPWRAVGNARAGNPHF